jgi:hypothetical protein
MENQRWETKKRRKKNKNIENQGHIFLEIAAQRKPIRTNFGKF